MASLTEDNDSDGDERFSDILIHNFNRGIQENREERKKRKGSPTPAKDDGKMTQEGQKRAKSPPPTVVSPTPPFIQRAVDANASNPPTPAKQKAAKEEAAKARPKKPESGQNLFGGDVPLAKLPALPKREQSFDWDPEQERMDFNDAGDDPFGDLPTITREEADVILEGTDKKPPPVLDSFDFDSELGLLKAVSDTDHQINEIIAQLGDGLLTQEEADRELDDQRDKLQLAKEMADNELESLKLYREKPCTVAKKSSVKKLTDNINIKF